MGINKEQIVHRPSALKQTNKIHKHGKHRSKGAVDALTKGKVSVKSMTVHQKKKLNKDARKHQAEQIRRNKRNEILLKKRCLGDTLFPPYLVCVLPLNGNIDTESAISMLCTCDEEAVVNKSDTNVTHIYLPRFKQRFSFYVPQKDNNLFILDALKVCDTVLFITTAAFGVENDSDIIDEWGSSILTAALAQSLPTTCLAVMDIESVHPKKQNETKQIIQKHISKWIPEEKLMCLGKSTEALNILRKIGNQKQKSILYRDRRSHLFAESYSYEDNVADDMGTLKVSGFLRGSPLSVNGLVHLPGLGDFQMSRIDAPNDPFIQKKKWKNENQMDASESVTIRILEKCDTSKQESLVSENIPDAMDAEQTWPTPEELKEAEENVIKKVVKKIPKGWSSYQAAWIPDIDGEIIESDSESEENMSFSDALSEDKSSCSDNDDDFKSVITESEINESDEKYDQGIDLKEENEVLRKMKDAKNDMLFPDEIDTPQDVSARERFQRYRGLESFRTSPWDPKENLPSDYARIFQFENFDRTRKRILKEREDNDGALPGWYITVHVTGVSKYLWESFVKTKAPLILFGLLPHEHKMSVLNVVLKRTNMYNLPIKAKERLIFQCGYRRFIVNPIFSHHTNGNKHKYERFFQPNTAIVATFYAPIQFPPSPVLCYKQTNDDVVLVATGNLLSVNPDRLIIKRTVLSGHPFKVHKRSAVIRFMFFNREDIQYFKPCKLRTKYGRIGHIKEPLGTHGHMKCVFDGQLKSQDTVLLNLYKRVFPKWTYEDCIVSCQDEEIETMQE